MIYQALFNVLNSGQGAYLATSLADGQIAFTENANAGLFDDKFIEHFTPYPQLVLLGAGHVSAAVCNVCAPLGFKVTVVDDREQFACKDNFPLADKIAVESFDAFLSAHEGGEGVYYAVLTRGHYHDRLCLEYILKKPCAYVGMIGSRRKNAMVFSELLASGYAQDKIDRVFAPIGIDIGADTPAEIAISISAQLISVRRDHAVGTVFDEAVLNALCNGEAQVLATICQKSGSAPRGVGAKMALLKNGGIAGTIGGGSGEAKVLALMRSFNSSVPLLAQITMTEETAKIEGLICGGAITVLINSVS